MKMNRDQDSSGFLPPTTTTTTNELRHQPPSPTTTLTRNNPHHLPGFTKLNVPPTVTVTDTDTTTQDPHPATTLRREIFTIPSTSFGDAVTATDAVNPNQEHTTTSTPQKAREPPRRNPLRRTLSDTTSTIRKPDTPVPGSSNRSESPQFKKLKKMKEMVGDEVRNEFGGKGEGVEDDNPSKVIVDQEEEEEEVRGESVEFRRLEDGSLSIKLSCSCGDCFEFVRNRIGCFYRLSI